MRSEPGSAPTSSMYGRAGAGAMTVSPTPGPCTASSSAALSRTLRLTQNSTPRLLSSRAGPRVMRPCEVFNPTSPQHEAGMRMEPPPSLACANGTMPAATAAAEPPLDPPGEWSVFHGLRVGPHASGSVVGSAPNSGLLVRPAITRPAALKRLTKVVSKSGRMSAARSALLPLLSGWPAYAAHRSFSRKGTPRNGPSGSAPAATAPAATWRAWSNQRRFTAFRAGSIASMRSMAASSSSPALTAPLRTSAA